jgi:hypothetical protein
VVVHGHGRARTTRWDPRGLLLSVVLFTLSPFAFAHPGGLDASGGHHDRRNGGYHCHRDGRPPQDNPRVPVGPPLE